MKPWVYVPLAVCMFADLAGSDVLAQEQVTIRRINAIPGDNIRELMRAGAEVTEENIRELIKSPLEGETVSVFGVVLSDPRNSGVAHVDAGRVTRVHFFLRDLAAATEGNRGMGIQVIDDRWEEHGVLDLAVGDVIGVLGVVAKSHHGIHLDPDRIDRVGRYDSLGLGADIFSADTTVSVPELNRPLGDGTFQANWRSFPGIHGSPVCLKRAVVARSSTPTASGRPDWAVSTDGTVPIYVYELSHRFRNDTRSTYPTEFNLRDDPFEPPSVGSTVSLCGFIALQAFNDPDGIGRPLASSTGSTFSIIPFEDSDLDVLEVPPRIVTVTRPENVLDSRQPFSVSAQIVSDPSRSITRVRLYYSIGETTFTKGMIGRPDSSWVALIPAPRLDGAFVRYRITALDNTGAEVSSKLLQYRVLDGGIDSISDIQETADGGSGDSPFAGLQLPVDIEGWIQSDPGQSGLVVLQDDSLLAPWSGILIDPASIAAVHPGRGDILRITEGRISERSGMTLLSDLSFDLIERGANRTRYVSLQTSQLDPSVSAEAYEGMLVALDDASLLARLDTTTWLAWNGSASDTIRISTASPTVSGDFLSLWQTRPFIRGVWRQRGGGWELVPETMDDFGEVVNVAATGELPHEVRSGRIEQAYPNPFALRTSILFSISGQNPVRLEAFDLNGRSVVVLVDGRLPSGLNRATFEASHLAAGPYLLRLSSPSGSDSRMVIRID